MNTMELHKAIYELNSQVCRIDDNLVAFDADGGVVDVDLAVAKQHVVWSRFRQTRNRLLTETDYLALSDQTLTAEMAAYRQALRDLPANTVDPANPVWPTKPGA